MSNYVSPQDILLYNRAGTPSVSELTAQVNALASLMIAQSSSIQDLQDNQVTVNPVAWAQPARSINSDFVVNTDRDALVFYTMELTATGLITGTVSATSTLNVQGLPIASVENLLTVTLALGVLITTTNQKVLIGMVPAGQTANITTGGTGTATLINVLEVLL